MPARKKLIAAPAKIRIDVVKVITGRNRTTKQNTGRVLEVDREKGRVLVEGAGDEFDARADPANAEDMPREGELDYHYLERHGHNSGGVATRVGLKVEGDQHTRIQRKTGEALGDPGRWQPKRD